ncbi:MAG: DUF3570 domain-containing protein [Kofleriaceae bacterium]|nr:DUF3570 domain-containing protein [Kofleriaceae bacterium]
MYRIVPFLAMVLAATVTGCAAAARVQSASTALYVRQDDDATRVISPRLGAAAELTDASTIEASWEVDAWTGASIDVTTAATEAIHEARTALTLGGSYQWADVAMGGLGDGDLRLSASYRSSLEHDYQSHGGVVGAVLELGEKNTTLAGYALGSRDTVGRADDPEFARTQWTAGGRVGLTQVLDPRSLVEVTYDLLHVGGFQASPYRWVAVGGMGVCAGDAPYCLPEQVPDARDRHAVSVRGRRALSSAWSTGLELRGYLDSWGVGSLTAQPDVAWLATDTDTLDLRLRYYTQGEASFYRPRYFALTDAEGYLTRDRKLSAFWQAEAGLSWRHHLELGQALRPADLGLRVTASRQTFLAFVGLEQVDALEVTVSFALLGE